MQGFLYLIIFIFCLSFLGCSEKKEEKSKSGVDTVQDTTKKAVKDTTVKDSIKK